MLLLHSRWGQFGAAISTVELSLDWVCGWLCAASQLLVSMTCKHPYAEISYNICEIVRNAMSCSNASILPIDL